jgi:hypothetical protein
MTICIILSGQFEENFRKILLNLFPQTNHLRHVKNFVEAQAKYYANCHQIMQDLQKELSKYVILFLGGGGQSGVRCFITLEW